VRAALSARLRIAFATNRNLPVIPSRFGLAMPIGFAVVAPSGFPSSFRAVLPGQFDSSCLVIPGHLALSFRAFSHCHSELSRIVIPGHLALSFRAEGEESQMCR
jgi:hypothetical protein